MSALMRAQRCFAVVRRVVDSGHHQGYRCASIVRYDAWRSGYTLVDGRYL